MMPPSGQDLRALFRAYRREALERCPWSPVFDRVPSLLETGLAEVAEAEEAAWGELAAFVAILLERRGR